MLAARVKQLTSYCFRKAGASDGLAPLFRYLAWACGSNVCNSHRSAAANAVASAACTAAAGHQHAWPVGSAAAVWRAAHHSCGRPAAHLGVLNQQLVLAAAVQLEAVVVQQALQRREVQGICSGSGTICRVRQVMPCSRWHQHPLLLSFPGLPSLPLHPGLPGRWPG